MKLQYSRCILSIENYKPQFHLIWLFPCYSFVLSAQHSSKNLIFKCKYHSISLLIHPRNEDKNNQQPTSYSYLGINTKNVGIDIRMIQYQPTLCESTFILNSCEKLGGSLNTSTSPGIKELICQYNNNTGPADSRLQTPPNPFCLSLKAVCTSPNVHFTYLKKGHFLLLLVDMLLEDIR